MMMRRKRPPTSPGEILQEAFLVFMKLTQKQFADHLGVDIKVINRLINGRTRVSAALTIRLASALRTTPDFWLHAQKAVDLYKEYARTPVLPEPISRTG